MTDQNKRFLEKIGKVKIENPFIGNLGRTHDTMENKLLCVLVSLIFETSDLYNNYYPNNFRKTAEEYYSNEIAVVEQGCNLPWKKISEYWRESFNS